jgi:hypothetical protein
VFSQQWDLKSLTCGSKMLGSTASQCSIHATLMCVTCHIDVILMSQNSNACLARCAVQVVRAAEDIPAGQAVSLSYLGPQLFAPAAVRQEELRQQWGFDCGCARCVLCTS